MSTNEITQYQYDVLKAAAVTGSPVAFAALLPSGKEPQATQDVMTSHLLELAGLVEIGLLNDITDKFTEILDATKAKHEREFRVFVTTPEAILMFQDDERLPN